MANSCSNVVKLQTLPLPSKASASQSEKRGPIKPNQWRPRQNQSQGILVSVLDALDTLRMMPVFANVYKMRMEEDHTVRLQIDGHIISKESRFLVSVLRCLGENALNVG